MARSPRARSANGARREAQKSTSRGGKPEHGREIESVPVVDEPVARIGETNDGDARLRTGPRAGPACESSTRTSHRPQSQSRQARSAAASNRDRRASHAVSVTHGRRDAQGAALHHRKRPQVPAKPPKRFIAPLAVRPKCTRAPPTSPNAPSGRTASAIRTTSARHVRATSGNDAAGAGTTGPRPTQGAQESAADALTLEHRGMVWCPGLSPCHRGHSETPAVDEER